MGGGSGGNNIIKILKKRKSRQVGERIRLHKVASRTEDADAPSSHYRSSVKVELQAAAGAQRSTTYLLKCT